MQERTKRRKAVRADDHEPHRAKKQLPPKKAHVTPLRRGDACLRCRAKKLKCSADKPVCDQCSKRSDSCVYDTGRPATRIEKLEAELAQMEDPKSDSIPPENPRPSTSSYGSSISQGLVTPYASGPPVSNGSLPYVHEPLYADSFRDSGTPDPGLYTRQAMGMTVEMNFAPSPAFGAAKGEPDGYSDQFAGWAWPTAGLGLEWTTPQHIQQTAASPGFVAPLGQSPFTVSHNNVGEGNYWSPSAQKNRAVPGSAAGLGRGDDGLARMRISSLGTLPMQADYDFGNTSSGSINIVPQRQASSTPHFMRYPPPLQTSTPATSGNGDGPERDLTEDDISQSARDYLLNLFFCPDPPRCRFGSECFTEAQFHQRLSLPSPSQPHPALLFSMYTIASSTSYIPAIKSLEESLYDITTRLVERAMREAQGEKDGGRRRLVDVVNASKNLSKWLFLKGRDLEGFVWSSKAISLAVACELHKIPSSVLQESQMSTSSASLLPPPQSQWELCERIHAFWSAWGNERARRLRTPWPSLLRDEMILTPLPRPPDDYLNGTILQVPDVNLRTLYNGPLTDDHRGIDSLYSFLFASLHLFHRASTVSSREIESPMSYRLLSTLDPTRSPREAYPEVCEEITGMCVWVESIVPDRWSIHASAGQEAEGWKNQDAPIIFLLLICARIHLLSPAHQADQQAFVELVDRAADLVGRWMDRIAVLEEESRSKRGAMGSDKGSWRNKHGLCGPYRETLFDYVVEKLGECEGIAMRSGDHAGEFSSCPWERKLIDGRRCSQVQGEGLEGRWGKPKVAEMRICITIVILFNSPAKRVESYHV
ncbi:hypothetical protein, variant 1 [Cryptococcus amylolentus CBS 6039]|uniref:Zn(2)-C6 fungal-type domain-containing protein n=1 Tax=Cryptococcus amylolentus CBS 6039 TaxID=1295533 RepID=A0A1E3HW73_9TREE|nr:hypothetical protein, variant 1 [Cryptococcus amylolentus CBS 6039]ODN80573.1 hypothetical protein, variant 1 [Cryptococcus amylolentus CBS 6039]